MVHRNAGDPDQGWRTLIIAVKLIAVKQRSRFSDWPVSGASPLHQLPVRWEIQLGAADSAFRRRFAEAALAPDSLHGANCHRATTPPAAADSCRYRVSSVLLYGGCHASHPIPFPQPRL